MGVLDEMEKLEKTDTSTIQVLKNIESNQQKIIALLEEVLRELKNKK
ncbi:MAG: hypothetical protein KAJ51_09870 [Thermoplasmata archaeon]|nr:hypothetical protein [Thermoplasmata archaeon]